MTSLRRSERRLNRRKPSSTYRPGQELENLEARIVLSFADGNGAVVLNVTESNNGSALVVTFDGPLNANPANPVQSPTNAANYSVQVPSGNPEVVTSSLSSVSISSASYNSSTNQVTLNLANPLTQGQSYRVFVNGIANTANRDGPRLDRRQSERDRRRLRRHGQRQLLRPVRLDDGRDAHQLHRLPGRRRDAVAHGPRSAQRLARARRRLQRRGPDGAGQPHQSSGRPTIERRQRRRGRDHAVRLGLVRRGEQRRGRHSPHDPGYLHQCPPVVLPGDGPRADTADPRSWPLPTTCRSRSRSNRLTCPAFLPSIAGLRPGQCQRFSVPGRLAAVRRPDQRIAHLQSQR